MYFDSFYQNDLWRLHYWQLWLSQNRPPLQYNITLEKEATVQLPSPHPFLFFLFFDAEVDTDNQSSCFDCENKYKND